MKRKHGVLVVVVVTLLAVFFPVRAQTMSQLASKVQSNSMKEIEKGKKALDSGRLSVADKHFRKALKLMEQNYQAVAYRGIVAFMKKDLKKSLAFFQESIEKFDVYKKYILERQRDYARTLQKRLNTYRVELDKHDAQYNGVNGSELENDYNSKKNLLNSLMKQIEKDKEMKYPAFFRFKYGNALFASREVKAAKEQYIAAVKTDPGFKDAYANLSVCWFIEGNCDKAVDAYKKAKALKAKINPRFEQDLKRRCGVK